MLLTGLMAVAVMAVCTGIRWFLEGTGRRPTEYLDGCVRVETFYNEGAAFGNKRLRGRGLLAASAASLVSMLWERCRGGSGLGTGLVLGGGLSNLLERIRCGRVFDYVRFPKAPGRWNRFVFNLADFAIFLGTLLTLLERIRRKREDR